MTETDKIYDVIDRLWGPQELQDLRLPEDNEILTELSFAIRDHEVSLLAAERFVSYLEAA